jgi:two-component system, cell cycle sensor histidine kinase and response regulator CckA
MQLFLLAFIMALPAAGIIVYSGIQMREHAIADAKRETQKLADSIAAENQNLLAAAQQLIIVLAQLPDVKRQNAAKVQPILRDILKLNSQFSNIFIADLNGLVWATAVPVKPPFIVSDRRYFKDALASGQLSSGEYVISRATTNPAFNVAYPLKDDRGMIIGVISVGFILDAYKQALERAKLPAGSSFILLDHKGVVLYRAINPMEYIGRQYDAELFKHMQEGPDVQTYVGLTSIGGDKRIVSYRKLSLPGEQSPYMYIRTGIPVDIVLSGSNRALASNLALFSSLLALVLFFAWLIGKRSIADRVTVLKNASRDLARGDLQVRISDLVVGGELGGLGQTFDTMARQLASRERALVDSEKNYRTIFNATKDAIFVHDADSGNTLETNKTAEELYGYSRDELLHCTVQDLSQGEPPCSSVEAMRWIQKTVREGPQQFEWLAKRKNGECFWVEVVLSVADVGEERRVLAVVRDITERKKTEEEQQKLVSVIEMSRDFISIADLNGGILYMNAAGLKLVGFDSPEDYRGKMVSDFLMEADHRMLENVLLPAVFGTGTWIGELALRHFTTGMPIPVDMSAFLIKDRKNGKPIALANISRDIADRKHVEEEKKKLQAQLAQSQKMESIGQLAGGIAHDFNNILAAIVGYGSVLQMKLKGDDPSRLYIDQILDAAERAANLTQSLLAFSRKQFINPKDLDLNDIIHKVEKFLSRIIGEDIEMQLTLSPEQLTVFADRSQIEQVLMNLATNARDAMPNGGQLIIETKRLEINDDYIRRHGYGSPGPHALLSVSDTGAGIDARIQEKIFEPFFTTKELGRGTGLGLSIVYGIVKQHKGYINVYSEIGRGTTFRIYLPLVIIGSLNTRPADVSAEPPRRGTETILLTEDDEQVRRLTKSVLEEFGYTVIEAADGEQALERFMANKDRIHMILVDVIMPRKNGRDVYNEAKQCKPDLKALFTSGYPADFIQKEGVLEEGLNFISKPSSVQDLLKKIREVLDK